MGKQTFTRRDMNVLAILRQDGQTMSYKEIGKRLSLTPYQAGRTVHKLQRHGLVKKMPGTKNAVTVTQKGMDLNPEYTVGSAKIVHHEMRYWTLEDFDSE